MSRSEEIQLYGHQGFREQRRKSVGEISRLASGPSLSTSSEQAVLNQLQSTAVSQLWFGRSRRTLDLDPLLLKEATLQVMN
jgi:hypothetical protein